MEEASAVVAGDAQRDGSCRSFGGGGDDGPPTRGIASSMSGLGSRGFEAPRAPGLVESQVLSTSVELSKASRAERASLGSADDDILQQLQ